MTRDMKLNPLTAWMPEGAMSLPIPGRPPTVESEIDRLRDWNAELHLRVMELETALAQTKPVEDYHGKVPQK